MKYTDSELEVLYRACHTHIPLILSNSSLQQDIQSEFACPTTIVCIYSCNNIVEYEFYTPNFLFIFYKIKIFGVKRYSHPEAPKELIIMFYSNIILIDDNYYYTYTKKLYKQIQ